MGVCLVLFFLYADEGMAKGKLITVCQSGGKFTSSSDGSLSYTGGDAHAFHRRIADFSYVGKWVGLIVKVAQPHSSSCQFLRSTSNISSDFHNQLSFPSFVIQDLNLFR